MSNPESGTLAWILAKPLGTVCRRRSWPFHWTVEVRQAQRRHNDVPRGLTYKNIIGVADLPNIPGKRIPERQ